MLMKSTGLFALAILLFLPRLGHAADEKAPPMKFDRMALYDVHGLWGGQNVYLTHDGTAWVQVSQHVAGKPGFQELRYKLSLNLAEMQSLEKLLAEHHFPDITIKDRPGVPDESRPTIEVVAAGITIRKSKWANDVNRDFTAVYEALAALVPKMGTAEAIYSGPFDDKWRPEGFEKETSK